MIAVEEARRSAQKEALELAVVVWDGRIGGAEVLSVNLCAALMEHGARAELVFVGRAAPLSEFADALGVGHVSLGMNRGSRVLLHPKRLARIVADAGRDGAILQSDGYLAGSLRGGGYRGTIVSVQHGTLLLRPWMSPIERTVRTVDQLGGVWALDALVAVSDRMAAAALRHPHPARVVTVPNGVDLQRFSPRALRRVAGSLRVGFAGRLVPGKGAELLIQALRLTCNPRIAVAIAGEGPERSAIEEVVQRLDLAERVRFHGTSLDMPRFWNSVDVAAVPSHPPHVESFGMVAAEAMACGIPVIASRNGALPDIVPDGYAGKLVDEGDVEALANALDAYAEDVELLANHGHAARRTATERFDLRNCARAYIDLFRSLGDAQLQARSRSAG